MEGLGLNEHFLACESRYSSAVARYTCPTKRSSVRSWGCMPDTCDAMVMHNMWVIRPALFLVRHHAVRVGHADPDGHHGFHRRSR
jgi:hypothetical protein